MRCALRPVSVTVLTAASAADGLTRIQQSAAAGPTRFESGQAARSTGQNGGRPSPAAIEGNVERDGLAAWPADFPGGLICSPNTFESNDNAASLSDTDRASPGSAKSDGRDLVQHPGLAGPELGEQPADALAEEDIVLADDYTYRPRHPTTVPRRTKRGARVSPCRTNRR